MCVGLCVLECRCLWRPETSHTPRAGVNWATWCGCCKVNSSPLQNHTHSAPLSHLSNSTTPSFYMVLGIKPGFCMHHQTWFMWCLGLITSPVHDEQTLYQLSYNPCFWLLWKLTKQVQKHWNGFLSFYFFVFCFFCFVYVCYPKVNRGFWA